jgi:sugar O-acyltransferase (sialic acid O-acetyltransferase NeuD family)
VTQLLGVYGASGCGRGLMPLLRAEWNSPDTDILFIDDAISAPKSVNGHAVLSWTKFLDHEALSKSVCLAIAAPATRAKLAEKCIAAGIEIIGTTASSVIIMDAVEIAAGACLSPFVTLTSNIRIGRCFHANLYSYVEHDCVIGDFVTFAPGVKCNGNVVIEDGAYLGAGAIIRQGTAQRPLRIGAGAVVGMGSIVTKDVAPGTTVIGNPARVMVKG